MTHSIDELKVLLSADEPRYADLAAMLDESDAPGLAEIAASPDLALATKAVYLAGLLPGDSGADVVEAGAAHEEPLLRVSAAAAMKHLSVTRASATLESLLADSDPGVRKTAIGSVPANLSSELPADQADRITSRLRAIAEDTEDTEDAVQAHVAEKAQRRLQDLG